MAVSHSKLKEEHILDLSGLFDLFARFDFEDAKKRQAGAQEVGKGSSLTEGESFLGSCENKTA